MVKIMGIKSYLKKVLLSETDFKKLWKLEKDVRSLDRKFGTGATSGLQLHIHNDKRKLEVEVNNNQQYWDREYSEMKKHNLSQYLKQFKKQNISYRDYKEELMDDLNEIAEQVGEVGGYSLYGSICEGTTADSDIHLFLINTSNYEYAKNKAKEYAKTRLMEDGLKNHKMKKTNEIHYMEVNLLQKESGKFNRFDVQIPFDVVSGKGHISDTDLNLISPYFDNANYLVLRYTPSELEINQTKYNKIDEKAVIDMKSLIKNEYGLDFIKTLKGKYHQPINAESKYDGVIDYYLIFGNKKLKDGGSINSEKTFNPIGSAQELGIIPNIEGHDMIAKCNCGGKFSYQNSKKNIVWECPECNGMKRISENKMGDGGSVWEKNGFTEYPRTSPQEWENVEWSLNGHSTSFKGKMYFQKGTGFMFIEKENGELYKPQPSSKLFWRSI
jgi:hypothetical protein